MHLHMFDHSNEKGVTVSGDMVLWQAAKEEVSGKGDDGFNTKQVKAVLGRGKDDLHTERGKGAWGRGKVNLNTEQATVSGVIETCLLWPLSQQNCARGRHIHLGGDEHKAVGESP